VVFHTRKLPFLPTMELYWLPVLGLGVLKLYASTYCWVTVWNSATMNIVIIVLKTVPSWRCQACPRRGVQMFSGMSKLLRIWMRTSIYGSILGSVLMNHNSKLPFLLTTCRRRHLWSIGMEVHGSPVLNLYRGSVLSCPWTSHWWSTRTRF